MTSNEAAVLISLVTGKEVRQHDSGSFRIGFHDRIPVDQLSMLAQKGVCLFECGEDKDGGGYRFTRFSYTLATKAN